MPDIEKYLKQIDSAIRGEDVRDAIIEILKLIATDGGNASRLNGHPASYFATKQDMDSILPLDTEIKPGGTKPVSSGTLYIEFNKIIKVIDTILGKEGEYSSIVDALLAINSVKWSIRNSILNKNVHIDTDAPFSEYADKIKEIEQNANINLTTLNVSKNGTYDADDDSGYKSVEVNVTPKLTSKTADKNTKYVAEDDKVEGYSEVSVHISGLDEKYNDFKLEVKDLTLDDKTLPKKLEDLPTKVYSPKDDEIIGYKDIKLDLSNKILPEKVIPIPGRAGSEVIVKASDEDFYGYASITVTVEQPSGFYTVEFFNGNEKIAEDPEVPAYGSAKKPDPSRIKAPTGKVFAGWNPNPVNVVADLRCYAQFDTKKDAGNISDTWDDIASNGGAPYDIGATKSIYVAPFTYANKSYSGFTAVMMKVANGEYGTTSTWLCIGGSPSEYSSAQKARIFVPRALPFYEESTDTLPKGVGWEDSDLQKFMNGGFIDAMLDHPDAHISGLNAFISSIATVRRKTNYYSTVSEGVVEILSSDKIWFINKAESKRYSEVYRNVADKIEWPEETYPYQKTLYSDMGPRLCEMSSYSFVKDKYVSAIPDTVTYTIAATTKSTTTMNTLPMIYFAFCL